MNHLQRAGQTFNTFVNLLKELEPFIDTHDLRLAFDKEGKAYLIGSNFTEQLQANPSLWREVQAEMRGIIAQHVPRIPPAVESEISMDDGLSEGD